jgi:hypothetical protein
MGRWWDLLGDAFFAVAHDEADELVYYGGIASDEGLVGF